MCKGARKTKPPKPQAFHKKGVLYEGVVGIGLCLSLKPSLYLC